MIALSLTLVMLVVYFGYIYLVAFNKDFLSQTLGAGVTTVSIPIGIGLILFTVIIVLFNFGYFILYHFSYYPFNYSALLIFIVLTAFCEI